jgi:hypothetical protein
MNNFMAEEHSISVKPSSQPLYDEESSGTRKKDLRTSDKQLTQPLPQSAQCNISGIQS